MLLWLAWSLGALLAVLLVVAWWAMGPGSLPRALELAQRFLPQTQQLEYSDVQGSLLRGGRIGRLQWRGGGSEVTIEELRMAWSLRLLSREFFVHNLAARLVHVRVVPQPQDPEEPPFTMPAELSLPLRVRLPLAVTRLQIDTVAAQGEITSQVIEDLAAGYAYDGAQHALRVARLRHGQSSLQAGLQLHARELVLTAQVDASLRNLVPDRPFAMQVHLEVDGGLAAGEAARLDLQADAREQDQEAAPGNTLAVLRARATVHPWRDQPVQQLELEASHLDARVFHQAAPITALAGRATLQPASAGSTSWNVVLDFTNDEPGSWDQQHMPLQNLSMKAQLSPQRLAIQSAEATMAGAAGPGRVLLAGEVPLKQPGRSSLRLTLQQLDLEPWSQQLPQTLLDGEASMAPPSPEGSMQLRADIHNRAPGPLDREQLPLDHMLADVHVSAGRWQARNLLLSIGEGQVQLQGQFEPQAQVLDVRGDVRRLPLRRVHTRAASSADALLSGTLRARGDFRRGVDFDVDMSSTTSTAADGAASRSPWEIRSLQTRGRWSRARLGVEHVHVDAFEARLDGDGIEIAWPRMDSVRARIEGTAPGLSLQADATMQQRSGGGRLVLEMSSADEVAQWLRGLPIVGDRLPALRASGSASLQAEWQGGWEQWRDGLQRPAAHPQLHADVDAKVQDLHVDVPAGEGRSPTLLDVTRFNAQLQGNLAAADFLVDGDLRANGSRIGLDMRLQSQQVAGTPQWTVTVGELAAAVTPPDAQDPWQLQVSEGLGVTVRTGTPFALESTAGSATLAPPRSVAPGGEVLAVTWQPLQWSRSAGGAMRLNSSGEATGLHAGWLDALLAPAGMTPLADAGVYTDLVMRGTWDVHLGDQLEVQARLQRESGDLWLGQPTPEDAAGNATTTAVDVQAAGAQARRDAIAAGIRTLEVSLQSEGEELAFELDWDSGRAGAIDAVVKTGLVHQGTGWSLPGSAPLTGSIKARLPDLGAWAFLAPPGWRVQGSLDADVALEGTVQLPRARGSINASSLNIRSVLDGVDLHDGSLRATVQGQQLQIAELTLQGGTGSRANVGGLGGNRTPPPSDRGRMAVRGTIDWSAAGDAGTTGSGIELDLQASLEKMQVLVRNDRQVSLSGELSAGLEQGRLRVRGDLDVDRAAIMLPEAGAPKLGEDVVVVRASDAEQSAQARAKLQTARPLDLEIKLGLGRDLALQGYGITTRLEGELTVSSATSGNDPFRIVGEVRTDEGRFRAWGQALTVETGVVLFNGPAANPSLNLLAIRPEIEVRAGVRVTGTLSAPRLTLFSEPEMSQAEKLSWVMLGRASATSDAEGESMQQAALSLLAGGIGGSFAGNLGLDSVGMGDSSVSIGKRVSEDLYLTYEAGFSGAASTLFIFYDITRKLTLRGQTSDASAVDFIYTIKYD